MRTIGVDVGGTSARAAVVDEHGGILDTARVATPSGAQELDDAIVGVVSLLRQRHTVRAVGLAVAGFVDTDRRSVSFAPHLAWRAAPVTDRVAGRLALPVVLEHDANAALLAEHRFGAARGARFVTLIALGTGIGAGLLLNGELFRGAYGVAPELGHLRLVPGGRACSCGAYGCWERYCSGTALATTTIDLLAREPASSSVLSKEVADDPGAITGRRVAAAAREGDRVALDAMAELARWLGEGLAVVADVYDPELVIVAGGVSDSAPLFLDQAREHFTGAITGAGHRQLARIRTTQLGDDAAVIGAAALAADEQ